MLSVNILVSTIRLHFHLRYRNGIELLSYLFRRSFTAAPERRSGEKKIKIRAVRGARRTTVRVGGGDVQVVGRSAAGRRSAPLTGPLTPAFSPSVIATFPTIR